ncbi:hypothetical protein GCM10010187_38200 [Actinomadura coerulea]|nr:hypothetical protein GCM10010187_38200 [Actinomadura coerulea]
MVPAHAGVKAVPDTFRGGLPPVRDGAHAGRRTCAVAGAACAIAWHRNYLDGERTRAAECRRAASRAVGFPRMAA